jgi:hypothetical protein
MSVEDRKFRCCCLIVLDVVSVNNNYVVDKEKLALRNGLMLVNDPHYLVLKVPIITLFEREMCDF